MKRRAFSALETLVVVGIVAITAGVSIPMYRNYQIRSDLDRAVEQTIQGLRRAQLLSQSGERDASWGFHVPSGTLFAGEGYSIRNEENDEVYPIPITIDVSGISEVTFTRVDGFPNQTGDIILTGLDGAMRIISVSTDGVLGAGPIIPPEGGDGGDDGGTGGASSSASSATSSVGSQPGGGSSSSQGGASGGDTGGGSSSSATSGSTGGTGGDDGGDGGGGDDPVEPCEDRFAVATDGTIETTGSVDVTFRVLGSDITYGQNGPEIDVRVYARIGDDSEYQALYNERDVDGGESETIQNLPSGTRIGVKIAGRYSWLFNRSYESDEDTDHIIVLRNGDALPNYQPFGNQTNLRRFLRDIIGPDRRISIGQYDAVLLVELGALNQASSDFQDAVILMEFDAKEGSCARTDDVKFRIAYERVENTGLGDAKNTAYVGAYAIPYAEYQWVPLQANGETITDNNVGYTPSGLSVRREDGFFRVVSMGDHPAGGHKEIVDARIELQGATITAVESDTGQFQVENPFDGIVNDGAGGDEITVAEDARSVLFQTRVTTANDAILIYWTPQEEGDDGGGGDDGGTGGGDDGGSGGGSSASSSVGQSSGGPTTIFCPDDQIAVPVACTNSIPPSCTYECRNRSSARGGGSEDDVADECAAGYQITEDGSLLLDEDADITFQVLGSHVTYGDRGPEVQVRLRTSFDGGGSWHSLYEERDVDGGETQTFRDVPAGSRLVLQAEGRYSWLFRSRTQSNDGSQRIRMIRTGEPAPGTTPFATPANLQRFTRDVLDNGAIHINRRGILGLVELQGLDAHSDYQDAAVLIMIEKPTSGGVCGAIGGSSSAASSTVSSSQSSASSSSSSSSSEQTMTICHFPSGNPNNAQTITIGVSAWNAHQRHGDREGACDGDSDGDSIQTAFDLCPNTYTPEAVPSNFMLFSRYALTEPGNIFRTGPRKKISGFTLEDTKGCSCEQILDVAEGERVYHFDQFPVLLRNVRSLYPFYTIGARQYGCSDAILKMVRDDKDSKKKKNK